MAKFDENIGGVNNRIGVIDPGPQGPSFLGGLADTASRAIDGISAIQDSRRRAQARRASQQESELEGLVNTAAHADDLFAEGVRADDAEVENNPAVQRFLRTLSQSRTSLKQTGNNTRHRTAVEMAIGQITAEAPHLRDDAFALAADQGHEHSLFQSRRMREAVDRAEESALETGTQEALEYGMQHFSPEEWESMTQQERVTRSSRLQSAEESLSRRVDMAEDRDALSAREQAAVDSDVIGAATEIVYDRIAPSMNQTFRLLNSGQLSESNAAGQFRVHLSRIEAERTEQIERARAAGASEDAIADINGIIDRQVGVLDRYINDPSFQAALNNFTNRSQLDFLEAVPQIAGIMEIPGAEGILQYVLGSDMIGSIVGEEGGNLRENTRDFLTNYRGPSGSGPIVNSPDSEFSFQYQTGGNLGSQVSLLMNAGDTRGVRPSVERAFRLSGQTFGAPINQVSEEAVRENGPDFINVLQMWGMSIVENSAALASSVSQSAGEAVSSVRGLSPQQIRQEASQTFRNFTIGGRILQAGEREVEVRRERGSRPDEETLAETGMAVGNGNPNTEQFTSRWIGMADWILNNELGARNWNPDTHYSPARRTLFNPVMIGAIEASAAEDPQFARQVFRAGSMMASAANGYQPNAMGLGSDRVVLDRETGRFVSEVRDENLGSDNIQRDPTSIRPRWPRDTAQSANRLVDTLVEISDLDPDLPDPSMSAIERRIFYVTGEAPEREVANNDQTRRGSSVKSNNTPTAVEKATDYSSMLISQEGGSHSTGYIPTNGSGVTVGVGLDLGQWSESGLTGTLGLSESLVEKLSPYVGLSTRSAVETQELDPSDLQLTVEEEEEINNALLQNSFERARSVPAWGNLDSRGREAVMSIRHWAGQLGVESSKLAPGGTNYLWPVLSREDATTDDIRSALKQTLDDMPDDTEARYNRVERIIRELS